MPRQKEKLFSNKVVNDKGRAIHCRVAKVTIEGRNGKPMSWNTFEVVTPFKFTRKADSWDGTVKAGEEDWGKDHEVSMGRLGDVLQLLYEVDQKFNEGRAFAEYKGRPIDDGATTLEQDEIAW